MTKEIEKLYFDSFTTANLQKAEADFLYCPKCKNKTKSGVLMLGKPEEYRNGMLGLSGKTKYPEGEYFICENCDKVFLVIYDVAKEGQLKESVELILANKKVKEVKPKDFVKRLFGK